jgi:hypothetical protein
MGFVTWFRLKYPGVLIFAVPNGGKRSLKTAKDLKAEGATAGIPDLFIPEWKLWVEMKRETGGVLSQQQRQVIAYLEKCGYTVIVGKGATDASRKVMDFLKSNPNLYNK